MVINIRLDRDGQNTMKRVLQWLRLIVQNPVTQLVTGLILLISGGSEVITELMEAQHSFRLGVHHGVALVGLIQSLGSLPDVVEGLEHSMRGVDKEDE